jgi:hypothetical protein
MHHYNTGTKKEHQSLAAIRRNTRKPLTPSPPPSLNEHKSWGKPKGEGAGGEGVRTNLARIVGDHNKNFKEENLKNWGKKGQEQWWHTVLIPPPCSALLGSHLYGGDLQLRCTIITLVSLYM